MKVLAHQTELMDAQETYIQLAVGQVEKMNFADYVDPLLCSRYSTLIIVLQLYNVMYAALQCYALVDQSKGIENAKVCLYPRLHLLDGNVLCISHHDPTHEVFGGIYAYFLWRGFNLSAAAHQSSTHLERARQIFLKYPQHYMIW